MLLRFRFPKLIDLPLTYPNTNIDGQDPSTSTSFSINIVTDTCTDINDAIDMMEEKRKEISTSSTTVVNITKNECKKTLS